VLQRADGARILVHAAVVKEKLPARAGPVSPEANRLLGWFAPPQRDGVVACCEAIRLAAGDVLMRPDTPATHAHFPLDAVVSLRIALAGTRHAFEVALVGPEGMVGLPLLLGASASTLSATVVKPGTALRIAAEPLHLRLQADPGFRQRMHCYVLVSLAQMAQAALCTRYHQVDERLARWLLMTQDRIPEEAVHATHEFLAATLGVRRAGVSRAAASLQQRELIAYHRGVLTVLDRSRLQAAACPCYRADRASYASLMGGPAP
jgi:CRP-like cAMP-binding protein